LNILGVSAYYHDSAAALVRDGRIVAAAQEERFSRRKHDPRFPHQALAYCMKQGGLTPADVDWIVFYDKPFLKFERLLETYTSFAPRGFQSFRMAMPVWLQEKLFLKRLLRKHLSPHLQGADLEARLLFSEHHLSHAASAFYPSPFEEAAIVTMDGVGEWATTSIAHGKGSRIRTLKEIHFPHSLGLLYSAFTYYAGFKVNSGEYKLMGLAPYGEPKYADIITRHLIDIRADGSFALDMSYFDYCTGLTMTNARFERLFGEPVRPAEGRLTQFHMDIAASIQAVTERAVLAIVNYALEATGSRNLCLAGGVALNCVANGEVLRRCKLDGIWIQPAAGDAGGAVGAALAAYHGHAGKPRAPREHGGDGMSGGYLGPSYSADEVRAQLDAAGARYVELNESGMLDAVATALVDEKAVGWFQGRMEFGPRALGGRSILGDPRSPRMQSQLNLKVKYRESFRPFAPAVLREEVSDWFDLDADSPYMLLVAPVRESHRRLMTAEEQKLFGIEKLNVPRSTIPAVTHVDYSARVQTVHAQTNPRFHALIKRFKARAGCPVVVNTSFNVRGEPIVGTPADAFRCFMGTEIEVLAIENFILYKEDQPSYLRVDYKDKFELD
jgi:carbamoyltransferase